MSFEPRPLRVVAISKHVPLLHEISWMLKAVVIKVQTSTDFDQDANWRRYSMADFVIIDARSVAEPTAATFALDSDKPLYRIFLYDPTKQTDLTAWYAAGAHDAIRTPVSRGELLARVRTGARFLEFERRLQYQSSRSAVPGMYSRRGFLYKLRKLAESDEPGASQHPLLATAIDWYGGIRCKCGETASHSLVNTAARAIKRTAGENSISTYLGDGRFATLLVGQSTASATAVAEALAKDFGSRESHHESIPRSALTSAIVPWQPGSNADRLICDALETLELAEDSGGGCVIPFGEINEEFAAWKEDMSTGNPFVQVVAQDIMEPFPAVLERDAEQSELAEVLRRSGIPVRPYVDRNGKLVGIAAEQSAAETCVGLPSDLAGDMLATPETISSDASFPEIYDAFLSRGCATLVVTENDRPLGYLTCEGFLSMIDPIHAASFERIGMSADDLNYLAVPPTIVGASATGHSAAAV